MFGFDRKKNKNPATLKQMDGREIKYVTRRIRTENGEVKETILGKTGRIVVLDGEIVVMCGDSDVFKCRAEEAVYYTLMSGDGITVSGINSLNGKRWILLFITHTTENKN